MENSEALAIVKAYGEEHGIPLTLETLMAMKVDENLSIRQKAGFAVAMHGFNQLFNGADA